MDGLCRAIAAPLPVSWEGQWRMLHPMKLRHVGAIENYLLDRDYKPVSERVAEKLQGLDQQMLFEAMELAKKHDDRRPNFITTKQFQEFIDTQEGLVMTIWMMLNEDRFIAYEEVDRFFQAASETKLLRWINRRNEVSGLTASSERDWDRYFLERREKEKEKGGDDSDEKSSGRLNWRYAVHNICEAYTGLSPDDVGNFSLITFRVMTTEADRLKSQKISFEEAYEMERRRRESLKQQ